MTRNVQQQDKNAVARKILAYLEKHPDACDTLEGVASWWVLEREIEDQTMIVKKVLEELTRSALIERFRKGHQVYYRIKKQI